ncbi:MAG: signal peptidase II [Lachnospiraceae bacterium]|nr:signal peptidase II [Lachnospiraceae bacterium]
MPYIMTLVSLFSADSIMKYLVEKNKKEDEETLKLNGKIRIKKYHNKGAMCNIGERNQTLVAMLSLVFSAFVTGIFAATLGRKGKSLLNMGLALILGGAYSNTYDRLKRKYVVDYLSFHVNTENCKNKMVKKSADKFGTIVFNISDFGIIIGAMFLVLSELFQKENE